MSTTKLRAMFAEEIKGLQQAFVDTLACQEA